MRQRALDAGLVDDRVGDLDVLVRDGLGVSGLEVLRFEFGCKEMRSGVAGLQPGSDEPRDEQALQSGESPSAQHHRKLAAQAEPCKASWDETHLARAVWAAMPSPPGREALGSEEWDGAG